MNSNQWMFRTDGIGDVHRPNTQCATFCQPVVVLSPEDREHVERLMRVVRDKTFRSGDTYPGMTKFADSMQAALREFANPAAPKPDEPMGLGAVVEDAEGEKWVRVPEAADDSQCWVMHEVGTWRTWSDITAVRILSEGFSDE